MLWVRWEPSGGGSGSHSLQSQYTRRSCRRRYPDAKRVSVYSRASVSDRASVEIGSSSDWDAVSMGSAQRSRKRLAAGTLCYLCGNPILEGEDWNRDHVPPKRIFPSRIRKQFSPKLEWLPTHSTCNSSYREDEEYFVVSFAGHVQTPIAREVMKDVTDAARKGHGVGLIREILGRFGKVQGPRGEMLYSFDGARTDRFFWKLIRGLYYLHLDIVLPAESRPPSQSGACVGGRRQRQGNTALGDPRRTRESSWTR